VQFHLNGFEPGDPEIADPSQRYPASGAPGPVPDEVDENLFLASRNLANVMVVEPRYADPLSLVHFKKVLVTKAAVEQLKEMFA